MKRPTRRQVVLGAIAVLILVLIVFAFLPEPVPVDAAVVTKGPLRVTVEEEGRTEVAVTT